MRSVPRGALGGGRARSVPRGALGGGRARSVLEGALDGAPAYRAWAIIASATATASTRDSTWYAVSPIVNSTEQ
ncbi:hypothetical protein GCM10025866_24180 [Naasia aerilata]|uniref:Uncharacterized protein n=1 Tax=Naasia aerilata TaxID=1162966 RepID=A0ABM8GDY8_9MICO|nr:hypothetical protein GCM10025866_24180 [Naasia aerilata]